MVGGHEDAGCVGYVVAPGLGAYSFCGCWIQGNVRAQVLGGMEST